MEMISNSQEVLNEEQEFLNNSHSLLTPDSPENNKSEKGTNSNGRSAQSKSPKSPTTKTKKTKTKKKPDKADLPKVTKKTNDKSESGDKKGRFDNSLGLLTNKFLQEVKKSPTGELDLNECATNLGVQKRRIYDITNVLEGIGMIEKQSKNRIKWKGNDLTFPDDKTKSEKLKEEIEELENTLALTDKNIEKARNDIRQITETSEQKKQLFLTYQDIRAIPSLKDQTIIAIKAPPKTRLEVPDPDEGMKPGQRRYQIFLTNEDSVPIDVYLIPEDQQPNTNPPAAQLPIGTLSPILPAEPFYLPVPENWFNPSDPLPNNFPIQPPQNIMFPLDMSSPSRMLRADASEDTIDYYPGLYPSEGLADLYNDFSSSPLIK
jgi:hypothetical protein